MRFLMVMMFCVFVSCSQNPIAPTVTLDTPFSLKMHQTAVIAADRTTIRFERTISDGRCPSDVVCFWEGEAFIEVKVTVPGVNTAAIGLPIFGYVTRGDSLAHRPVDTLGYRFTLMQLDPYPRLAAPHPDAMDVALIRVSRLTQ